MSRDMPKLAIYPSTRGLSSIEKQGFQHVLYGKIRKKKEKKFTRQFLATSKIKWSNLRTLFPKDSKSLKFLDIRLWEVGAKRRLNSTSKVNRRTDGHTNRHTDISTYKKHRPRGPILWKCIGYISRCYLGSQEVISCWSRT